MSFYQISRELGIPINEVKTLYRSGMKKLRQHGLPDALVLQSVLDCKREHAMPPPQKRPVRLAVN